MSQTVITCSECGASNSPTRLHCTRCGAKLDLNSIRFQQGRGGLLKRALHGLVFACMLALLGGLLWSPSPEGAIGSREDGYAAYQKVVDLVEAIATGRTLHRDFSEQEMNAYLAVRVDDTTDAEGSGHWQLALENINLSFTEAGITVHIDARWRFLTLTYTIDGEPFVEGQGMQLRLQRVALGRVPIPGPLQGTFAMRMMPILEALDPDWAILQKVTRVGVRPETCRIKVGP